MKKEALEYFEYLKRQGGEVVHLEDNGIYKVVFSEISFSDLEVLTFPKRPYLLKFNLWKPCGKDDEIELTIRGCMDIVVVWDSKEKVIKRDDLLYSYFLLYGIEPFREMVGDRGFRVTYSFSRCYMDVAMWKEDYVGLSLQGYVRKDEIMEYFKDIGGRGYWEFLLYLVFVVSFSRAIAGGSNDYSLRKGDFKMVKNFLLLGGDKWKEEFNSGRVDDLVNSLKAYCKVLGYGEGD